MRQTRDLARVGRRELAARKGGVRSSFGVGEILWKAANVLWLQNKLTRARLARRRRAEDGEAEQTRRARRGREQDFAEISRRMYEEIRSSRDPRDHVEYG